MHRRTILVLSSTLLLLGAAACSTGSSAEQTDEKTATAQAETEAQRSDAETREQGQQEAEERRRKMAESCPARLEETDMRVQKLDDAVAVDFTTTGDVDALRDHVRTMAQMHNEHHEEGMMHRRHMQQDKHKQKMEGAGRPSADEKRDGGMMHGDKEGMGRRNGPMMDRETMQMMAATTAETEEIDEGMRVRYVPDDPDQLDALHKAMQRRVEMMKQRGECPMMQMMGGQTDDKTKDGT